MESSAAASYFRSLTSTLPGPYELLVCGCPERRRFADITIIEGVALLSLYKIDQRLQFGPGAFGQRTISCCHLSQRRPCLLTLPDKELFAIRSGPGSSKDRQNLSHLLPGNRSFLSIHFCHDLPISRRSILEGMEKRQALFTSIDIASRLLTGFSLGRPDSLHIISYLKCQP